MKELLTVARALIVRVLQLVIGSKQPAASDRLTHSSSTCLSMPCLATHPLILPCCISHLNCARSRAFSSHPLLLKSHHHHIEMHMETLYLCTSTNLSYNVAVQRQPKGRVERGLCFGVGAVQKKE